MISVMAITLVLLPWVAYRQVLPTAGMVGLSFAIGSSLITGGGVSMLGSILLVECHNERWFTCVQVTQVSACSCSKETEKNQDVLHIVICKCLPWKRSEIRLHYCVEAKYTCTFWG